MCTLLLRSVLCAARSLMSTVWRIVQVISVWGGERACVKVQYIADKVRDLLTSPNSRRCGQLRHKALPYLAQLGSTQYRNRKSYSLRACVKNHPMYIVVGGRDWLFNAPETARTNTVVASLGTKCCLRHSCSSCKLAVNTHKRVNY